MQTSSLLYTLASYVALPSGQLRDVPERGVHSERIRRQLLSRTFNGPEIEELTHFLGIG
jgi:hypothetical protein